MHDDTYVHETINWLLKLDCRWLHCTKSTFCKLYVQLQLQLKISSGSPANAKHLPVIIHILHSLKKNEETVAKKNSQTESAQAG